jgi:hypothetical protein
MKKSILKASFLVAIIAMVSVISCSKKSDSSEQTAALTMNDFQTKPIEVSQTKVQEQVDLMLKNFIGNKGVKLDANLYAAESTSADVRLAHLIAEECISKVEFVAYAKNFSNPHTQNNRVDNPCGVKKIKLAQVNVWFWCFTLGLAADKDCNLCWDWPQFGGCNDPFCRVL